MWVVIVFLDQTLVANAAGPFRSEEKARAEAERFNTATEEHGTGQIAQVVRLQTVAQLIGDTTEK